MLPAHPPLPIDCSLPFQPDAGIQISILISESLEGARVAVTRQKAGRVANWVNTGRAPIPNPPASGGVKAAAATTFADMIVVFNNLMEARLSQDAALTDDVLKVNTARAAKKTTAFLAVTTPPPCVRTRACSERIPRFGRIPSGRGPARAAEPEPSATPNLFRYGRSCARLSWPSNREE